MNKYELGIVDIRNIIATLDKVYAYNFKDYALTFLKRRIERIIEKYNLKDADGFISKITEDVDFFNIFLHEVCVEITEMYRDPSLWRILNDEILIKLFSENTNSKIWFPEVSSGEELFSTAIILKRLNLLDNVRFVVSSISKQNIQNIQEGIFDSKKLEVNESNFKRIFSDSNLSDYYSQQNELAQWDISLIKNTKFIKQNIIFDDYPKGVKLVLFRNQMIYYNQILQEHCIKNIYDCLIPGGYLIIGNNEKIDYWGADKDFAIINKFESIYKKKLS